MSEAPASTAPVAAVSELEKLPDGRRSTDDAITKKDEHSSPTDPDTKPPENAEESTEKKSGIKDYFVRIQ